MFFLFICFQMSGHPGMWYTTADPSVAILHVTTHHTLPRPYSLCAKSWFAPWMSSEWISDLLIKAYRCGTRITKEYLLGVERQVIRYEDPGFIGFDKNGVPTRTLLVIYVGDIAPHLDYPPHLQHRIVTGYPV